MFNKCIYWQGPATLFSRQQQDLNILVSVWCLLWRTDGSSCFSSTFAMSLDPLQNVSRVCQKYYLYQLERSLLYTHVQQLYRALETANLLFDRDLMTLCRTGTDGKWILIKIKKSLSAFPRVKLLPNFSFFLAGQNLQLILRIILSLPLKLIHLNHKM